MKTLKTKDTSDKTINTILKSFKQLENFEELHDLKKITEIASISKKFIEELDTYYRKYVKSFFKTGEQMIEHLSATDQKSIFDNTVERYNYLKSSGRESNGQRSFTSGKTVIVDHWTKNGKPKNLCGIINKDAIYLHVKSANEIVNVNGYFDYGREIKFEIDEETNTLHFSSYWETHSPFSRPHNPIVLYSGTDGIIFDLNTNTLISTY